MTIGIGFLIFIGICVQLAVTRRYRLFRRDSEEVAYEKFEKDVEWQLQHELSDAIEASSNPVREENPLVLSPLDQSPHITFADPEPAPGSYHDFKAYSRAELDRLPSLTAPADQINGILEPPAEDFAMYEVPLYVNPKQFHRILKRRMARQVFEDYFRSRTQYERELNQERLHSERLRRPRGPNGRFLTLDEVAKMPNGVVAA